MEYKPDKDGYVIFGHVSRNELKMQCQYGSDYLFDPDVHGCESTPNLGKGLRFRNLDVGDYHGIEIHIDDVPELVRRYKEYRNPPPKKSWWRRVFSIK